MYVMEHYTTTSGEVIALAALAPDVEAFLRRALDATHDPNVSEAELASLIFGLENPLLDTSILPGRAVVTNALRTSTLYVVFMDLLSVKSSLTVASALDEDEEDAREATYMRTRAASTSVGESPLSGRTSRKSPSG